MAAEDSKNGGGMSSRMDRVEAALELFIRDHEQIRAEHQEFRDEHKRLLTAQVVQQGDMERDRREWRLRMDETTDKLNALIDVVDQTHKDIQKMEQDGEKMRQEGERMRLEWDRSRQESERTRQQVDARLRRLEGA